MLKPPFGSLVAIDMHTGEHRWRIPVGRGPVQHPAIRHLGIGSRLGNPARSWALVTRTVLLVVQMGYFGTPRVTPGSGRPVADLNNRAPHLWVHDKKSGDMLAAIPLPANAAGAPMTYLAEASSTSSFPWAAVLSPRSSSRLHCLETRASQIDTRPTAAPPHRHG